MKPTDACEFRHEDDSHEWYCTTHQSVTIGSKTQEPVYCGVAAEAVIEPRHPLTDEPANTARAARVALAIEAYARETYGMGGEEPGTIAQDFITDVLHWWAQQPDAAEDVDAADVVRAALTNHVVEVMQERGESGLPVHVTVSVEGGGRK